MSDFESSLTSMLQAEASTASVTLDLVDAARRLESGLDEIDRERRSRNHRTAITVAAAFVAAAVVVAVTLVVGSARPTTPEPVKPPTPFIPGGEVVKPHPFLQRWDLPAAMVRLPQGAPLPRLTACVADPRTWGAGGVADRGLGGP